jgi:hypothetical protein
MLTEKKKVDFVISNFNDLEAKLIDCLSYIPYFEQNIKTISPKFVPIILEACSLIESIFKDSVAQGNYNFKNYLKVLDDELDLSDSVSILLTSPIQFLTPYDNWQKETPIWWKIYNRLKHDRLNNLHLVTLDVTVFSLCALHQLISKHRGFTNQLIERSWISPDLEIIGELIAARLIGDNCLPMGTIPSESNLFVSPLRESFVEFKDSQYYVMKGCDFSNRVKSIISIYEFNL